MKNTITGYVIPNWKVKSEYYHFDVHIVEYENGEDVEIFNETINDSQLFDIIQALGEISEEDDIFSASFPQPIKTKIRVNKITKILKNFIFTPILQLYFSIR